jgi:hypothetical protein
MKLNSILFHKFNLNKLGSFSKSTMTPVGLVSRMIINLFQSCRIRQDRLIVEQWSRPRMGRSAFSKPFKNLPTTKGCWGTSTTLWFSQWPITKSKEASVILFGGKTQYRTEIHKKRYDTEVCLQSCIMHDVNALESLMDEEIDELAEQWLTTIPFRWLKNWLAK